MQNNIKFLSVFAFALVTLAIACTPKTTQPAQATEEAPTPPASAIIDENLSPCGKFYEATDPSQAETAHVLYRDFLKTKKYDEAFKYWQQAYKMAPAADGKRDYHFLDGIKLYEHFLSTETDEAKRSDYIQKIFGLYDEATNCYPERTTMYKGLKAFKLYYTYQDQATPDEVYQQFKEVIDIDGKKTADFVINPFTALMMEQYLAKKISQTETQTYAKKITEIIEYGTKNCKDARACDRWDIVKGYAPLRLEELEGVKGFYDCAYYKDKYLAQLEANPEDCELISVVYGRLKWGGCSESDAALAELKPKLTKCFPPEVVSPSNPVVLCKNYLREGNYQQAIDCYEEKAGLSTDPSKKAQYYLTIAKIYYAHLKKFSSARKYARKASEQNPSWGAPHILIGKLYASSGPLCGPGRGFDSQVVTWVAIDEWNKAKNDPESASEARKLINKYAQFMPSKEDVFIRNLKVGGSYKVACWIQQNTKIRTAD